MADKKITDLQLRDNVTEDLNLPSDDGLQSYRVTAQQLKEFVLSNGVIVEAMLAALSVSAGKIQALAVTDAKTNFTAPTFQIFRSGSGTYTTPAGVKWIRVRMVGGGGGGGGSGTTATVGGSDGGSTTFGTSLLTATGGIKAALANVAAGGTATINSPAIEIYSQPGGIGAGYAFSDSSSAVPGGVGGATPFGSSPQGLTGVNTPLPPANSGVGGGGAGCSGVLGCGSGGGGGGYIEAVITSPSSTYAYAVGAGGTGGSAGTSGRAGANGAAGIIIVEEHYQ